jgi:hypothetical protein
MILRFADDHDRSGNTIGDPLRGVSSEQGSLSTIPKYLNIAVASARIVEKLPDLMMERRRSLAESLGKHPPTEEYGVVSP